MLTYRQIAEAMLGVGKHSFDEALRAYRLRKRREDHFRQVEENRKAGEAYWDKKNAEERAAAMADEQAKGPTDV